jgi:DNA replication protein DnaC
MARKTGPPDQGRKPIPSEPEGTIERIRRFLDALGLTHTRDQLDDYLAWATREHVPISTLLERIFGEEAAKKRERAVERRFEQSGLKVRKTLEAFDWNFQPGLDRAAIVELAGLDFVRRADDLVFTGKSGTGKSHILQALTLRGCEQQLFVRYSSCVDLLDDLYAGLGDGTYPRRLKRWCAPTLLVIDDVGLGQVKKRDDEPTAAHTLFALIDKRHTRVSTALSSNIKLSEWGRYLGDATLAAAILDRLALRATRIDIDGPSYRQHVAHERAKARGKKSPPDDSSGT